MLIRDLMQADPVTVADELPLLQVAETLMRHHITGAPVVDHGKLVGVISRSDLIGRLDSEHSAIASAAFELEPFDSDDLREEDTMRVVNAIGSRWAGLKARDVMTSNVRTLRSDESIDAAASAMAEAGIHRLPIVDDGVIVGILSPIDVLEAIADGRLKLVDG